MAVLGGEEAAARRVPAEVGQQCTQQGYALPIKGKRWADGRGGENRAVAGELEGGSLALFTTASRW